MPTTDPNSLLLPSDPLESILKHIPATLLRDEDKWTTDADALKRIRNALHFPFAKAMTDKCWHDEGTRLQLCRSDGINNTLQVQMTLIITHH